MFMVVSIRIRGGMNAVCPLNWVYIFDICLTFLGALNPACR
jgi:hypothetical protein